MNIYLLVIDGLQCLGLNRVLDDEIMLKVRLQVLFDRLGQGVGIFGDDRELFLQKMKSPSYVIELFRIKRVLVTSSVLLDSSAGFGAHGTLATFRTHLAELVFKRLEVYKKSKLNFTGYEKWMI